MSNTVITWWRSEKQNVNKVSTGDRQCAGFQPVFQYLEIGQFSLKIISLKLTIKISQSIWLEMLNSKNIFHIWPPLFFIAGSDVGGGGVHFLLLPDGLDKLPPAAGPAGLVCPGGRAPDAGCRQEAEAGCIWEHGGRLHELQPAGVLCGRHATRLSGGGRTLVRCLARCFYVLCIQRRLSHAYFQQHRVTQFPTVSFIHKEDVTSNNGLSSEYFGFLEPSLRL